ncbi:WG repeat-containing protein [Chryseobacterium sp. MEBOG07]|uniref:WG repeat-containing protein n=1 Tax=Chryseobacterium sp. MEBOG07 TaxID=2879939 RepID=UPI001F1A35D0|nr:WG repeat-containing protein [Chryseobacterium sp. MEBOG07]UKB79683.1 WG repeat-containing protein [Chryseobacterium sp. MEBOG07]
MKKLVFVLCSVVCTAQTNQYMKVILSKKIGKEVNSYSDGYGTIYDSGTKKQGIVDSLGAITFESPYKGGILHVFKNRFILYSEEGNNRKSAIIDEKGKEIISLDNQEFNTPWWSRERIISSKQDKEAVYDYNGKEIIPYSEKIRFSGKNRFFVLKDKKWFLYDLNGKQVTRREFKEDYSFEDGRALIINDNNESEIIGDNGHTLHQFSKQVMNINAYPYLITRNKSTGKYGLIDAEENTIAEEIYSDITPEYFGGKEYIYLEKKGKTTVFNKKDRNLYPQTFKYLNPLLNNFFSVYNDKVKKSGIIDLQGNIILPQEYDFIRSFTISGKDFIYLKKGNEEQFLDKDLKNIVGDGVQIFGFYPESLILEKQDKYYTFSVVDHSMKELKNISQIKNEDVEYFNPLNQYSKPLVCKNTASFYGILDGKGTEIVPFVYEDIITFGNAENEIVVRKEGKFGVSNFQNELLKEIIYDKYFWQKEVLKLDKDKKIDFIYFTRFRNNSVQL